MTISSHNPPTRHSGVTRSGMKWGIYMTLFAGLLSLPFLVDRLILSETHTPAASPDVTIAAKPVKKTINTKSARRRATGVISASLDSERHKRAANEFNYANNRINSLLTLISSDGSVNEADAQQIYAVIQRLVDQGDAAVPAILEFLRSQENIVFENAGNGNPIEFPSLRTALLEALGEIGSAAAEEVLAEVLKKTTDPAEVATAALNLEDLNPDVYQKAILKAALRSLESAAGRKSAEENSYSGTIIDTAPVFLMLQRLGNEIIADELVRMQPRYEHYSTIALGKLTDGKGIPNLIHMSQSFAIPTSEGDRFTLHMLAQVASNDVDAGEALLDKVRANEIPHEFWPALVGVIAGDNQLQIENPENTDDPMGSVSKQNRYSTTTIRGIHTQKIYSINRSAILSPDELDQRIRLLNRLAEEAPDPSALQAINNALSLLSGQ